MWPFTKKLDRVSNEVHDWCRVHLADEYGCDCDWGAIERGIYKDTSCGAFIQCSDNGVVIGTIVEGVDTEYSEEIDLRGLELTNVDAIWFIDQVERILQDCEDFANQEWSHEQNMLYEAGDFEDLDLF